MDSPEGIRVNQSSLRSSLVLFQVQDLVLVRYIPSNIGFLYCNADVIELPEWHGKRRAVLGGRPLPGMWVLVITHGKSA
jgi:hypothetical protein